MVSKFLMKSSLAVSLVFFMGTTVWATISGTSTTQTSCTAKNHLLGLCSINVEGLLKGLGNVTNNPTAFAATLFIQEGKIFCKNPAGNSLEGNGVPFTNVSVALEGADTINQAQVSRNGKALSDVTFHDAQMIAAVENALDTTFVCQHSNWVRVILVKKAQVFGEQFSDPTPDNDSTCQLVDGSLLVPPDNRVIQIDDTCFREDALATQCFSPIAANPDDQNALDKSLVWKQFTYDCTTLCHDKDANVVDCPTDPTVLPFP